MGRWIAGNMMSVEPGDEAVAENLQRILDGVPTGRIVVVGTEQHAYPNLDKRAEETKSLLEKFPYCYFAGLDADRRDMVAYRQNSLIPAEKAAQMLASACSGRINKVWIFFPGETLEVEL